MRIGACLLAIILLVGCAGKDKIPSGVLPKEKMEKILWDMMEADQYVSIYLAKDSNRINEKMETLKLYQTIFEMNKVSRDEFRESYQFYQGRPDLSRSLFDSLLTRGNKLRMESYRNPPVVTTPQVLPSGQVGNAGIPVVRPMSNPVPGRGGFNPARANGAGRPGPFRGNSAPGAVKRPVNTAPKSAPK
jgi:uncharacterized protein DUF4296